MLILINQLYYLIVSLRPRQWLKNLSVFAAVFFGGQLLDVPIFIRVSLVFILFCSLSSGMYLLNDLVDKNADKAHFSKKNRPIASNKLSNYVALVACLILILLGLLLSLFISETIFLTAIIFVIIQGLYTISVKKVIILDVMVIAFLFMLRVFAGSFTAEQSLSSWLILTVLMLSLFLAIGKRRSEVTLLSQQAAAVHRSTLSHYPISLLDGLTFMMATAALLTYSLFTFNTARTSTSTAFANYLPQTLSNPRWLMVTIPLVIYGIFRYLYLVFEKKEGESPEKILLSDLPLFTVVVSWLLIVFLLIYVFNI